MVSVIRGTQYLLPAEYGGVRMFHILRLRPTLIGVLAAFFLNLIVTRGDLAKVLWGRLLGVPSGLHDPMKEGFCLVLFLVCLTLYVIVEHLPVENSNRRLAS